MSDDTLSRLLAGRFEDPDGGGLLPAPSTRVAIRDSLAGREADLVGPLGLGRRIAVVSDPTTRVVLGRRVEQALAAVFAIEPWVLDDRPVPDDATATRLLEASRKVDALIAVGSGTITDLCKFVAARSGKPFAVFATAPSMNGYASPNAAITVGGHKKSLAAAPAAAVFMDLEVLASAPVRLIRAGLGDAACRSTAQADWLLAHLLLGRPYRDAPFALLADDEAPLFEQAAALVQGNHEAVRRLARTLVLSGFGMALVGGSEPASQGEHLISHTIEMMADPSLPQAFHGEQIGVTTLTMARLQEQMLDGGPPKLTPDPADEGSLIDRFGPDLGRACWSEFRKKRLDPGAALHLNARIQRDWDLIRARIGRISRPAAEIQDTLEAAGAPTSHEDLGWPRGVYRSAVRNARLIRNRYTFLDLAAGSGVLDTFDPS